MKGVGIHIIKLLVKYYGFINHTRVRINDPYNFCGGFNDIDFGGGSGDVLVVENFRDLIQGSVLYSFIK